MSAAPLPSRMRAGRIALAWRPSRKREGKPAMAGQAAPAVELAACLPASRSNTPLNQQPRVRHGRVARSASAARCSRSHAGPPGRPSQAPCLYARPGPPARGLARARRWRIGVQAGPCHVAPGGARCQPHEGVAPGRLFPARSAATRAPRSGGGSSRAYPLTREIVRVWGLHAQRANSRRVVERARREQPPRAVGARSRRPTHQRQAPRTAWGDAGAMCERRGAAQ